MQADLPKGTHPPTASRRQTPGPERAGRSILDAVAPPLVVLLALLALWHFLAAVVVRQAYLLPTPWQTVQGGWDARDDLSVAVRATFVDSLAGLGLSIVLGLLLAIIITSARPLERGLLPYATVLQTIPIISIAPLIIIWIGTGDVAVVVIALIVAIFPIISNASLGLTSIDHNLLNLATMYNANPWQQLIKLRLPYALPYILAGVRISSGLAVLGVIVGQYFAGQGGPEGGIGYILQVASRNLQIAELFSATVLASIMGILIFFVVSAISTLWLRTWHESSARREN